MSIFESITDLATTAHNFNRVHKKDVFKAVQDLALDGNDATMTETDKRVALAQLYKYFMPAVPAKPKTTFDWICKAMPKDDVRYYLNYVYSDGVNNVATDSHRLHFTRHGSLISGFHDKAGNRCECDGKYPNWERVVPQHKKRNNWDEFGKEIGVVGNRDKEHTYRLFLGGERVCTVNKKYMDDALSGMSNPSIYWNGPTDSIYLVDGERHAVIMPMRE